MKNFINIIMKALIIFFIEFFFFTDDASLSYQHLMFALSLACLLSMKYDLIKYLWSKNSRYKYILSLIIILLLANLAYCLIYYSSFKIFNYGQISTINSIGMISLESIFSVIVLCICYLNKKNYVIERLLKWIFFGPINIFVIFTIIIQTIHNKFLLVKTFKYASIFLVLVFLAIIVIKSYLAILESKKKITNKKLIVVLTSKNFQNNLLLNWKNYLSMFNQYEANDSLKSLIINGKTLSFVSYDLVRLGYITDLSKATYLIIYNSYDLETNYQKNAFFKKIKEISLSDNNFLIYGKSSYLKKNYTFHVTELLSLKSILDVANLNKDADEIKTKSQILLNNISDEEKNTYIRYGLKVILKSFHSVEHMYTILKMCEYIIHYLGLKSLLDKDEIDESLEGEIMSGTWRHVMSLERTYHYSNKEVLDGILSEHDVCDSCINLNNYVQKYLNKEIKEEEKEEFSLKEDLCQVVGKIRNNIVAHGMVNNEIANAINKDLFNIFAILLREFTLLNVTIEENDIIKNLFEQEFYAVYHHQGRAFLYSNPIKKNKEIIFNECLNYETGQKRVIDAEVTLHMDIVKSKENILKDVTIYENNQD